MFRFYLYFSGCWILINPQFSGGFFHYLCCITLQLPKHWIARKILQIIPPNFDWFRIWLLGHVIVILFNFEKPKHVFLEEVHPTVIPRECCIDIFRNSLYVIFHWFGIVSINVSTFWVKSIKLAFLEEIRVTVGVPETRTFHIKTEDKVFQVAIIRTYTTVRQIYDAFALLLLAGICIYKSPAYIVWPHAKLNLDIQNRN